MVDPAEPATPPATEPARSPDSSSSDPVDPSDSVDPEEAVPVAEGRDRRRIGVLHLVLVAVLTLAVGFGAGVWLGTPRHPADDSAEAGFTRDMITHHGQAVSMAIPEYRLTSDTKLRTIAMDIALTQQAQIGMMSTWLDTWGLPPTSTAAPMSWMPDGDRALLTDGRMPGMASEDEINRLDAATGTARDLLFCQLMIRHHLGGIHMVDAVLDVTDNAQVRHMARTIKDSQQSEVNLLQEQVNRLKGTP